MQLNVLRGGVGCEELWWGRGCEGVVVGERMCNRLVKCRCTSCEEKGVRSKGGYEDA